MRKTKWIKTKEDWYPSYKPGEWGNPLQCEALRVSMSILTTGEWRVSVWGADDHGLEKDFQEDLETEAQMLYDEISDYYTEAKLRSIGLYTA
jgi:hypothetical protein